MTKWGTLCKWRDGEEGREGDVAFSVCLGDAVEVLVADGGSKIRGRGGNKDDGRAVFRELVGG